MDVAFTLGLGAGLLIAAAVLAIMSAKNAWKYDERQRIARGEASAWALKLIVAANIAGILAQLLDLISTMTLLYLLTGAMIAAAALFAGDLHLSRRVACHQRAAARCGVRARRCVFGQSGAGISGDRAHRRSGELLQFLRRGDAFEHCGQLVYQAAARSEGGR